MAYIYKSDAALLQDYWALPQEYQIKAAKYIKNLRRLQKAESGIENELREKKLQIVSDGDDIHCSFCGKSADEAFRLIASGDLSNTVYICDECSRLCNEILDEETSAPSHTPVDAASPPKETESGKKEQ